MLLVEGPCHATEPREGAFTSDRCSLGLGDETTTYEDPTLLLIIVSVTLNVGTEARGGVQQAE